MSQNADQSRAAVREIQTFCFYLRLLDAMIEVQQDSNQRPLGSPCCAPTRGAANVRVFIAQLVEHCSANAEATGLIRA